MLKKITFCACVSRNFIDKDSIALMAAIASLNGWEVRMEADLCELAANDGAEMASVAEGIIVGCHERALKAIVESAGATPNTLLNIRTNGVDKLLGMVAMDNIADKDALEHKAAEYRRVIEAMPRKWGEDAWYPVLDKDVCGECSKCLDFCPFGVYEMVDGRVRVVHPHKCKNNCPACARTCPAGAVIFPKYEHSPINGGEKKEESAIQLDTKTLYSTAFKERLEARKLKLRGKS